jgi:ArsR family transcriptional regulator
MDVRCLPLRAVARTPIFDRLSSLADPTRGRLLLVLDRHELTVGELCQALQLPQSTVSRHLKQLGDLGWITSRAEGASRLYRMVPRLDAAARKLWHVVREALGEGEQARRDGQRVHAILERRTRTRSEFFSTAAGQWDTLRAQLVGPRADVEAMLGLLDPDLVVGDLGCGTGQLAARLAPHVRAVIGVDGSRAMLAAARRRMADAPNVDLRHGDLEALPIADGTLDLALLVLVLHYQDEPVRVLAEARRALAPGGRLLVVDMVPHEERALAERMGHVWQGIGEEMLGRWLEEAGFAPARYVALPADPDATGPALFTAVARTPEVAARPARRSA